jgi:hypothetical protein
MNSQMLAVFVSSCLAGQIPYMPSFPVDAIMLESVAMLRVHVSVKPICLKANTVKRQRPDATNLQLNGFILPMDAIMMVCASTVLDSVSATVTNSLEGIASVFGHHVHQE